MAQKNTSQKNNTRTVDRYRGHGEEASIARADFAAVLATRSARETTQEVTPAAIPRAKQASAVDAESEKNNDAMPEAEMLSSAPVLEASAQLAPKRSRKKKTVRAEALDLAAPSPTQEDKATVERLFQSPWGAQPKTRADTLAANDTARTELAATFARFEAQKRVEAEPRLVKDPTVKIPSPSDPEFQRVVEAYIASLNQSKHPPESPQTSATAEVESHVPSATRAPDISQETPLVSTPEASRAAEKNINALKATKPSRAASPKKKATQKKPTTVSSTETPAVPAEAPMSVASANSPNAPKKSKKPAALTPRVEESPLDTEETLEGLEAFDAEGDSGLEDEQAAASSATQRPLGSSRADANTTRQALSKALSAAAKEMAPQPEAATATFTRLRERRTALPPERASETFDSVSTSELDAALDEIFANGNLSGDSPAFLAIYERAIRGAHTGEQDTQTATQTATQTDAPENTPLNDNALLQALATPPSTKAAPAESLSEASAGEEFASEAPETKTPLSPSQAEFEYLQKDGEALFMRDSFEASRTANRLAGRIPKNESCVQRAQDLAKVAAEIDDVVARTRAAAEKDATDPRLADATWVAGGLISDYIALLELERRIAAEEASKLAREGVAVFLDLPGLEPEALTPTQAWSAALRRPLRDSAPAQAEAPLHAPESSSHRDENSEKSSSQAPNAGNAPKGPSVATPVAAKPDVAEPDATDATGDAAATKATRTKYTKGFRITALWQTLLGGVAGALLVTACLAAWEFYSPTPVLVTADRERLREETALLRLAHTRPGMPERADLRGLDAHAIDLAIAAAHGASRGADLPLVDSNLLLFPSSKVLDITNDVRLRLGIRPSDLATLEAAVREGWSATPALAPEAPAQTTPVATPTKQAPPERPKASTQRASSNTTATATPPVPPPQDTPIQRLEAADYAEAHPEAQGQDLDFPSRVRRVVAHLRGLF